MDSLFVFQKGFNFSQDGPGNRLVYHLSGCSASCPWCSNPEGKKRESGKEIDIQKILSDIKAAKPMFFEGGGVTFTGGEATEQFSSLKKLLTLLKQEGINTCLETNGSHPHLEELFPLVDFLIMDCKHHTDEGYRRVIGYSGSVVFENIKKAATKREQFLLRIPLIGGYNATAQDAAGFVNLFNRLGVTDKFDLEVLRYHEYGKEKYDKIGEKYLMTDEAKITDEVYREFIEILKNAKIHLINT